MPKRTVCIQNPAALSIKNDSLVISKNCVVQAKIPLEDIWVLIIESHQAQITTAALSKMVDAGIGVMLCGDDHMPNGLLLPLGAHSRHAAIVDDQLAISKPLQKRLWQSIVKAKVSNQAKVLELLGEDATYLRDAANTVQSGDVTNRESVAASWYFKRLIPSGTRRNGSLTAALDYGYAVLRAGIGRSAVSGGWLVSRGIHHCNNLNAFNLVDDLIEPFRPIVDLLVLTERLDGELSSDNKLKLASIFEYQVATAKGTMTVQSAIDHELDTLKAAILAGDASLLQLPSVIPLSKAALE